MSSGIRFPEIANSQQLEALVAIKNALNIGTNNGLPYQPVAASQTDKILSGDVGDWIDRIIVIPTTTSPGSITLKDGNSAPIIVFGGGTNCIEDLKPFAIPLNMTSQLGGWSITNGANMTCLVVGRFVTTFPPVPPSPPPPPPTGCRQLTGIHVQNSNPGNLADFESFLGRPVDMVRVATGHADIGDFVSSVSFWANLWVPKNRRIHWSIPLLPTGTSLTTANSGALDDEWTTIATTIMNADPFKKIIIRTGWEFNGSWQPWFAGGQEALFVQVWQRFVNTFRAVSNDANVTKFLFEWCPNIGESVNLDSCWPGDGFVDIVSMDFYYDEEFYDPDFNVAWDFFLTRQWGLNYLTSLKLLHGKQVAVSEWGVDKSAGSSAWFNNFRDWAAANELMYQIYWNSDEDHVKKGPIGYPAGDVSEKGAAYLGAFGAVDPREGCDPYGYLKPFGLFD